jgi:hypothetical protein
MRSVWRTKTTLAVYVVVDCPGKLIKVQTRESKQVIHELVEEVKKEKKPAIHRDLPSSHSKKLVFSLLV